MDRINMTDWQKITLQEKFGKRKQEKKSVSKFIIIFLFACVFFSLLFLNTESQVLIGSNYSFPGFPNIGDLSHG
jgi:dipeptide/tripeptide permease